MNHAALMPTSPDLLGKLIVGVGARTGLSTAPLQFRIGRRGTT